MVNCLNAGVLIVRMCCKPATYTYSHGGVRARSVSRHYRGHRSRGYEIIHSHRFEIHDIIKFPVRYFFCFLLGLSGERAW
jgi:hypothetical protein